MSNQWPLMIVRQMDCVNWYPEAMEEILETLAEQPGSCDEIWFAISSFDRIECIRKEAERILPLAESCRKKGIIASFQQGITLGHAPFHRSELSASEHDLYPFSAAAWSCGTDGEPMRGLLCPTSPEAREYLYCYAKVVLEVLRPGSYWLDDDTRLCCKPAGCFCPRCLELFSRKIGRKVGRKELVDALFGKSESRQELRRLWSEFNAESLAGYAASLRKAADEVFPECRLGIQTVFASDIYDGSDCFLRLKALSGKNGTKAGIRPGAGFYSDDRPREMNRKACDVAWEAARCKTYGFVGQVCYEAENYPHISIQKSPGAMMTECALMLAAGANSLALYWHSPENREPHESYEQFARCAANHRPYFEELAGCARETELYGVSRILGSDYLVRPWKEGEQNVFDLCDPEVRELMECGIPVAPPTSDSPVRVLTAKSAAELGDGDADMFSKHSVLMDVKVFAALQQRYPDFCGDVTVEPPPPRCLEQFGSAAAQGVAAVIRSSRNDLQVLSRIARRPQDGGTDCGIGSCVFQTGHGGKVALVQALTKFPTFYRRKALLDALDLLCGGFAVRLENALAMDVLPRVDQSGKIAAITLLNLGIGATPELKLTVRNPLGKQPRWVRPNHPPVIPQHRCNGDGEKTLILPGLAAWEIGTLFF